MLRETHKEAAEMELTDLPNIGPVLAGNLKKIGVDTPEIGRAHV